MIEAEKIKIETEKNETDEGLRNWKEAKVKIEEKKANVGEERDAAEVKVVGESNEKDETKKELAEYGALSESTAAKS